MFPQEEHPDGVNEVAKTQLREAACINVLAQAFSASQELQNALSDTCGVATSFLDCVEKLDVQCTSRLGTDWRGAGDEDLLTVAIVRHAMTEAHAKLDGVCQLVMATTNLWNQAAPSDVAGAAKLLTTDNAYLETMQLLAKGYHEFQQDGSFIVFKDLV